MGLRFTAHYPGVSSSIVGTNKLAHFQENLAWVEKGPLSPDLIATLRAAFQDHDQDWFGLI